MLTPHALVVQAVIVKNTMLVFGGEFTSPNQERFHHYKVGGLECTSFPAACACKFPRSSTLKAQLQRCSARGGTVHCP